MYCAIVDRPIDPAALLRFVARVSNGATVLFVGTVRDTNEGRDVAGIEYVAYRAMAARELQRILEEAGDRFDTADLAVEHRVGALDLGECSVAVAVAHPRRGSAFDAARYVVEELKKRVPIWKREMYADGRREWVHAGLGTLSKDRVPDMGVGGAGSVEERPVTVGKDR
jgi:molybdopterin synthase catalytic subunit